MVNKVFTIFRKGLLDIGVLISIGVVLAIAPSTWLNVVAKEGLFNLFISKVLWVSCGFLHAHIGRHIAFPYLDLKLYITGKTDVDGGSVYYKEDKSTSGVIFILVWYVGVIYCWCLGG